MLPTMSHVQVAYNKDLSTVYFSCHLKLYGNFFVKSIKTCTTSLAQRKAHFWFDLSLFDICCRLLRILSVTRRTLRQWSQSYPNSAANLASRPVTGLTNRSNCASVRLGRLVSDNWVKHVRTDPHWGPIERTDFIPWTAPRIGRSKPVFVCSRADS